jgi:CheY-like chemotaxis protein
MEKQILVIDDEKVIRRSFELTFEGSGYKVVAVSSGQQGIDELTKNTYNLVFLDLKMSGMDGLETLERIRRFNKKTLIYIFTAFHKDFFERLTKAAEEGLEFEIVQKPMDGDELLELVRNLLN